MYFSIELKSFHTIKPDVISVKLSTKLESSTATSEGCGSDILLACLYFRIRLCNITHYPTKPSATFQRTIVIAGIFLASHIEVSG